MLSRGWMGCEHKWSLITHTQKIKTYSVCPNIKIIYCQVKWGIRGIVQLCFAFIALQGFWLHLSLTTFCEQIRLYSFYLCGTENQLLYQVYLKLTFFTGPTKIKIGQSHATKTRPGRSDRKISWKRCCACTLSNSVFWFRWHKFQTSVGANHLALQNFLSKIYVLSNGGIIDVHILVRRKHCIPVKKREKQATGRY